MRGAPLPSASWQAMHAPLYNFSPFSICACEGADAVGSIAPGATSFKYTAIARTSASLIFEVELSTTSAIGPPAWLLALRPLCRYSTMSSTLHDLSPLFSEASSLGANQPSTRLPPNLSLRFSAPARFFGVWHAPQWAAASTR